MGAIVFGHRGASIEQPENTLESFALALELGVDVLETDVHLTSDGHVVVHHDDTGERMACCPRAVARCPLEEVKRWNVAFGFRGALHLELYGGPGAGAEMLAIIESEIREALS